MKELKVTALTVAYGEHIVLHDVDLHAPVGTVTGVIGPNGAGKSTLLKAVAGLVRPVAGEVTFGGAPVTTARASIAYLPQRGRVDWDYPATVADVVAMGRYPLLAPWQRFGRRHRQAVDEALGRVGMADLRNRHIRALSGGQQQRMFLARALAQEAEVLLLDEPFVGVDMLTVEHVSSLLRDVAVAGAAVVVVDHDLVAVDTLCDRLLLLNGRAVAHGPTADVLVGRVVARAYGRAPLSLLDDGTG